MYSLEKFTLDEIMIGLKEEKYEIPALQRGFVWSRKQVLDFIQSAYDNIPLGTLCIWEQDNILLYDGSPSSGWLVIDGQQRLSAILSTLLGKSIPNHDNDNVRIIISFNPVKGEFKLKSSQTLQSNWITDIATLFTNEQTSVIENYVNQEWLNNDDKTIARANLRKLTKIESKSIGVFKIDKSMPFTHVNKIFQQVNQSPTKIGSIEICRAELQTYHPHIAELLTRFCLNLHSPEKVLNRQNKMIEQNPLYDELNWMQNYWNEIDTCVYKPNTSDLMKILIWKTFRIGSWDTTIGRFNSEGLRKQLEKAIKDIICEKHFVEFNKLMYKMQMFINRINQGNIAYFLYLEHHDKIDLDTLRAIIYRWLLTINLQGELRGSGDTQVSVAGFIQAEAEPYTFVKERASFATKDFFEIELPLRLKRNSARTNGRDWQVWQTVQALENDTVLFSNDPIINGSNNKEDHELHHLYPVSLFNKINKSNVSKGMQDCIANRVITTKSVNRAIGTKMFHDYVNEHYNHDSVGIIKQMEAHCIPSGTGMMEFEEFLEERAKLMSAKIKRVYENLIPKE